MNITSLNRRFKILVVFTLLSGNCTFCQDGFGFLKQYENIRCDFEVYDGTTITILLKTRRDTIPINQFNSFLGSQKGYYIKDGLKRVVTGIGKIRIIPPTEIEDWSHNLPEKKAIKSRVLPICSNIEDGYTNFIYLYSSFEVVYINLIVLNKRGEIISGVRLFEGNFDYLKNVLNNVNRWTRIDNSIFVQEITDETPEQNKFTRKFKQKADGYFEEIE